MEEDTPLPEPEKPRFLLPDGCKDLIDALRLQQPPAKVESPERGVASTTTSSKELPVTIAFPDPVTVRDLASALHLKPFEVISTLMELHVFASINSALDFNTASMLCSRYGVTATKVA